MPKIQNETIIEQLNWRYAVKKFDSTKKISDTNWNTLEESLRLSPSSYGLQPWKFLIVQNPDVRKKLTPASWNQPQIETCSHLVVMTVLKEMSEEYVKNYFQSVYKTRDMANDSLKSFEKQILANIVNGLKPDEFLHWTTRQSYIAMGIFMTVASLLEIDTCPMEGINPDMYDDVLGLKHSKYHSVAAITAGYRAPDDEMQFSKKVRFDRDDVITVV